MVYQPAEDSFSLAKEVKKYLSQIDSKKINELKILDMGSGSGIQAFSAIETGALEKNILCIDVDPDAVKLLKKNGLIAIKSDLFSNIKGRLNVKGNLVPLHFDLIIFNAPYLPEDKYDKKPDTTAGKEGYEIIIQFLRQAKNHLNNQGIILLLFSSLSKPKIILKEAKSLKYNSKKLSEINVGFFEKLFVYEFEEKQ